MIQEYESTVAYARQQFPEVVAAAELRYSLREYDDGWVVLDNGRIADPQPWESKEGAERARQHLITGCALNELTSQQADAMHADYLDELRDRLYAD